MSPYRKNLENCKSETLSTEQKISNLYLEISELKNLIHQHPNILLQLKYNKLSVDIKNLVEKLDRPNYYKYLFIIIFVFNILKFLSK